MDRKRLEHLLKAYHNVLFLMCSDEYLEKISFYEYFPADKNTLIISTKPYHMQNAWVEVVTGKDAEELYRLYRTYEFTDHLYVLDEENTIYADIFQFVKSGILTYEEAWRALLE